MSSESFEKKNPINYAVKAKKAFEKGKVFDAFDKMVESKDYYVRAGEEIPKRVITLYTQIEKAIAEEYANMINKEIENFDSSNVSVNISRAMSLSEKALKSFEKIGSEVPEYLKEQIERASYLKDAYMLDSDAHRYYYGGIGGLDGLRARSSLILAIKCYLKAIGKIPEDVKSLANIMKYKYNE